jgi:hypothetical protein
MERSSLRYVDEVSGSTYRNQTGPLPGRTCCMAKLIQHSSLLIFTSNPSNSMSYWRDSRGRLGPWRQALRSQHRAKVGVSLTVKLNLAILGVHGRRFSYNSKSSMLNLLPLSRDGELAHRSDWNCHSLDFTTVTPHLGGFSSTT